MSSSVSSPPLRLISDELWALVEPLIPPRRPAVHGRTGRPRRPDRDVLEGIAFVLSTGIGWTKLPRELGYGSGWTCRRRMRQWQEAGVFDRLHRAVLDHLGERGGLDWVAGQPRRPCCSRGPSECMRRWTFHPVPCGTPSRRSRSASAGDRLRHLTFRRCAAGPHIFFITLPAAALGTTDQMSPARAAVPYGHQRLSKLRPSYR